MFPPPRCDDAARATLGRLVDRSRRHHGIQLPTSFVRGSTAEPAPLAAMLGGRRGAETRIKLYLSTVLLAGGENEHPVHGPHVIDDVAGSAWARALALPEPGRDGARHVAAAQSWLHDYGLLSVERRPGREPLVRLRSADGKKQQWRRPKAPYVTIPLGLWRAHWIWFLNAKELAVLTALLDLQGGRGDTDDPAPQWLTQEEYARYGFSAETWRLASKSLEQKGLLEVEAKAGAKRDFETPRKRKTFWVTVDRLDEDALEVLNPGVMAAGS